MHSINLIIIGKCEDNMHIHTAHTGSLLPSYVMPWHSKCMCKLITKVERKIIFLELERNIGNCQLHKQKDGVANIYWLLTCHIWPLTQFGSFSSDPLRHSVKCPCCRALALFLDGDKILQYYKIFSTSAGRCWSVLCQGQTNQKWIGYLTRRDWTYWLD